MGGTRAIVLSDRYGEFARARIVRVWALNCFVVSARSLLSLRQYTQIRYFGSGTLYDLANVVVDFVDV